MPEQTVNIETGSLSRLGGAVVIDLELHPVSNRLLALAAVRMDTGESLVRTGEDPVRALRELDVWCEGAPYLVGHNVLDFDRLALEAFDPRLKLLQLPVIDTLRLNPLAFPRNPYHRLVKHYRDGRLVGTARNDPEADCRSALTLLAEQVNALRELASRSPNLARALHGALAHEPHPDAAVAVFELMREQRAPAADALRVAVEGVLSGEACSRAARDMALAAEGAGWPLAYALAWISVAAGDSVMPPWVRHRFPQAAALVRRLRAVPCNDRDCSWCREHGDPITLLRRWFGFDGFRPEPSTADGVPLQQEIVARALAGESLLGILPTGTGKSLCYQLPALAHYERSGGLTVVISPLVALMADQVESLRRSGIVSSVAVNGLLSLPERHDALERIRLGDAAIVLLSPEQLRSPVVGRVLAQREIAAWVIDEAHCLSKWGHDFRPDYRYIARFARKLAGGGTIPPVLGLTATAKPAVIRDIVDEFERRLGVTLRVLDGGSRRPNLSFRVRKTSELRKLDDIAGTIAQSLPDDDHSGAIVYSATRRETERVAAYLQQKGFPADHFHVTAHFFRLHGVEC